MLLLGGLAPLCIAKFLLDALLLLVLMQKREKAGALFRKPRFADDAGTRISKGVDLIHIHPARDKDLNQAIVAVGPAGAHWCIESIFVPCILLFLDNLPSLLRVTKLLLDALLLLVLMQKRE